MKKINEHWFLTADRKKARLFSASRTPHDRLHVDEVAALYEAWDELQHDRPSPRAGKDGHSYASIGHEDEERIQRFSRQIAEWVGRQVGAHSIERLHVFSARRLLGALRHVLSSHLEERVVDHALDLGDLTAGELAKHGAIEAAAGGPGYTGPDAPPGGEEAHAALCQAIDELRREVDRLALEPGPIHQVGKLGGMLRMFQHHLRAHLRLEEHDEMRDAIAGLGLAERNAAESLAADQRELEARLTRLIDGVKRAEDDGRKLSNDFVEGLREFLAHVLRHENARRDLARALADLPHRG